MPQVIARCPLTRHYLFMGMNVDEQQFAALPAELPRKFCPFCSCEHAWFKRDTKLVHRKPSARPATQRAL